MKMPRRLLISDRTNDQPVDITLDEEAWAAEHRGAERNALYLMLDCVAREAGSKDVRRGGGAAEFTCKTGAGIRLASARMALEVIKAAPAWQSVVDVHAKVVSRAQQAKSGVLLEIPVKPTERRPALGRVPAHTVARGQQRPTPTAAQSDQDDQEEAERSAHKELLSVVKLLDHRGKKHDNYEFFQFRVTDGRHEVRFHPNWKAEVGRDKPIELPYTILYVEDLDVQALPLLAPLYPSFLAQIAELEVVIRDVVLNARTWELIVVFDASNQGSGNVCIKLVSGSFAIGDARPAVRRETVFYGPRVVGKRDDLRRKPIHELKFLPSDGFRHGYWAFQVEGESARGQPADLELLLLVRGKDYPIHVKNVRLFDGRPEK